MSKKINKVLKNLIDNKYRNSILSKNNLKQYFSSRFSIIKKKNFSKKKYNLKKNKADKRFIITFEELKRINLKKKLLNRDIEIISNFYKKFSSNLSLKNKYDLSFKKKSNIQTEIGSYILLCRIILRHNFLKTSQKLNVILKLNDISILNYNSVNNIFLIKILKKNIKLEFNLLKSYL